MTDSPGRNTSENIGNEKLMRPADSKRLRQDNEIDALKRQLDFESLMVEFAVQLLRLPISSFAASLDPWLRRFAESLEVDRVSLMDFHDGPTQGIFSRNYVIPGVRSVSPGYRPPPIPYIDEKLKHNEVINWSRIPEDVPDDLPVAEVPFLKNKVKSFLAVPLVAGDVVVGAGVFGTYRKERIWSPRLIHRIRFLGEIIANTLIRQRDHKELVSQIEQRQLLEERHTAVVTSAGLGFWIIDLQGNIKEANDAYCRLVGYDRDEILSMQVQDLDLVHTREKIETARKSIEIKGELVFETRHRRKDGGWVDLEVSSAMMPSKKEVFTFFRDITEKKQHDREFQERFRFESLISEVSTALSRAQTSGLMDELGKWLAPISAYLGADRCVVAEYFENHTKRRVLQSYSAPDVPPGPPIGDTQSTIGIHQELRKRGHMKWERIPEDIPEEMDPSNMPLVQDGTKSYLAIAIESEDDIIGALVFNAVKQQRTWSADVLGRLRLIAQILSNVLVRERSYAELDMRYRFERLVSALSADLMEQSPDKLDTVIPQWLEKIVHLLQVDRSGLSEFVDDKGQLRFLYGYSRPEVKRAHHLRSNKTNTRFIAPLLRGESIILNRIPDDLPKHIDPQTVNLVKDGVKSFLCVPLKARNTILGTLSLATSCDEHIWQADQISQIGLIGEIIAGALLRKQTHLALLSEMERRRRLEERNTTFIESAIIGFMAINLNGEIIDVNKAYCQMTGYSPDELRSMTVTNLDVELQGEALHQIFRQYRDKGGATVETRHRCKDGSFIDLEINSTLLSSEGQVISFLRDVTGIKAAQREVEARLAFESFVSEFSAALIRLPVGHFAMALKSWLERLANFLGINRIVISRFNGDLTRVRTLQEYSCPDLAPLAVNDDFRPSYGLQHHLVRGEIIKFENLPGDLPPDSPLIHSPMIKDGTRSLVALPLESGPSVIGIAMYSAVKQTKIWSEEDVRRLKLVSQLISNALMREETAIQLESRLKYEALLAGCSTDLIYLPPKGFEADLAAWLEKFADFIGVDHVTVSEIDKHHDTFHPIAAYYCGDSVPPKPWESYRPPSPFFEQLLKGEMVRMDKMPDDIPPGVDRRAMAGLHDTTRSLLAIPLTSQEGMVGIMVFSRFRQAKTFTDSQIRRLRLLGEIITNFVIRRRSELDLEERLGFEALISEFSATLINLPTDQLMKALDTWIKRLTEFLNVDRGIISEYLDDLTHYRVIHSYSAPFLPPLTNDASPRPVDDFLAPIREGKSIIWERIPEDMPDHIKAEETEFVRTGTKSSVLLPLKAAGEVIGVLTMLSMRENKNWSDDIVRRFQLMAEIIANAIVRSRADIQLSAYKNQLEELVEARTAELKTAQADLVRNERLTTLGKLTATVSHELRNPLGTIRSSLYSINQRTQSDDNSVRRAVERAERGITRCDRIVDELLSYSRVPILDLTQTHIDQWLEEILKDDPFPLDIPVQMDFNADANISVDRERMGRCLINLLTNGAQAVKQAQRPDGEGHLRISTRKKDKVVEIQIVDNGVGIDADNMEKIFEPLFSTKTYGIGLGVPIAKQIIEQHNGSLVYQSAVDRGTTVTIELPISSSAQPPVAL